MLVDDVCILRRMAASRRRAAATKSGWSPAPRRDADLAGLSPRDRILEVASDLFYREGVRGVGVDRIIEEAGVAKATFYRHFPSKDDLVVAWLRQPETRGLSWLEGDLAKRTDDPFEQLGFVFDVLAEWLASPHFRGCAYINSAVETPDPQHPVHEEYRREARTAEEFLARTAAQAGLRDPDGVAAQLMILVAGVITRALAEGNSTPVSDARRVADHVLTAARA